MTDAFFGRLDWNRPWLHSIRDAGASVRNSENWRQALNDNVTALGIRNHRGLSIQFVPQAELPTETAYEAYISATGRVPTRDNLHDFFNALVWLSFPRTKVQLNALQANEIERAQAQEVEGKVLATARGNLRDAATIFDENAALLLLRDPSILETLRDHRWHEVFVERREEFTRNSEVWLFGHALMEKLVCPYKAITAHAFPIVVGDDFFSSDASNKRSRVDHMVAALLRPGLTTRHFTPLPVLGVPGWWDGQDSDFYKDASVFRPRRRA